MKTQTVSISVNIWSQLLLLKDTLEAFFMHAIVSSFLSLTVLVEFCPHFGKRVNTSMLLLIWSKWVNVYESWGSFMMRACLYLWASRLTPLILNLLWVLSLCKAFSLSLSPSDTHSFTHTSCLSPSLSLWHALIHTHTSCPSSGLCLSLSLRALLITLWLWSHSFPFPFFLSLCGFDALSFCSKFL